MDVTGKQEDLSAEIAELRHRLEEANDTIEAIRTGEIDALVVSGNGGTKIYTLKSADQTYRVFIEKMNEGAVTLNKEGLILYSNSRFAEMVNLPLSKITGSLFTEFVEPASRDEVKQMISKAWDKDNKGEIMLLKRKGEPVPVLYSLTTLEMDEGKALSIIVADLTQQKETEKQLKEKNLELQQAKEFADKLNNELELKVFERTKELLLSREHFKFLADNIPVIAWKTLASGTLDYMNKRWYEFTGLSGGTAPEDWFEAVHPDDHDQVKSRWQYALENKLAFQVEFRLMHGGDKQYHWHVGNAVPFMNEHQEVIAWFGIAADIDAQKKELEKKDEFINMVSHELKTPVASLKGFTQLLMMKSEIDANMTYRDFLGTMDNQINKLMRLISDLLDATRFKGGELQFNYEPFDFNRVAREIIGEMQLTTGDHELKTDLGDSVIISGDRNRIGQVMTNLISNAIKYSPDSQEILISSALKNGSLEFCVKDHGIGIPDIHQSKIFTRFFRVTDNKAGTFPGLGLGLYISMGIIEKHGGKMWVKSKPEKGSEFYFTLPYQDVV